MDTNLVLWNWKQVLCQLCLNHWSICLMVHCDENQTTYLICSTWIFLFNSSILGLRDRRMNNIFIVFKMWQLTATVLTWPFKLTFKSLCVSLSLSFIWSFFLFLLYSLSLSLYILFFFSLYFIFLPFSLSLSLSVYILFLPLYILNLSLFLYYTLSFSIFLYNSYFLSLWFYHSLLL